MSYYKTIGLVGAVLLVGCAGTQGDQMYLSARNGAMVQVPAPLSKQDFSQYYVLPNPTGPAEVKISPVSLE